MPRRETLAATGEELIRFAFERYRADFRQITRRASRRFERREWLEAQNDAKRRLDLYGRFVDLVEGELREALGEDLRDPVLWERMRELHAEGIASFPDEELAETFFNSVTRRVFDTVGVDPRIEFVDLDIRRLHYGPGATLHRTYARGATTAELVAEILRDRPFAEPLADPDGDAARVAAEIDAEWARRGNAEPFEKVEMIEEPFHRGTGTYLVGRIRGGGDVAPLVMVVVHASDGAGGGLAVDAVLLTEREVRIVFSYTRASFHVDVARPSDVVLFLSSIMPKKPVAELYMSLGHNKHGKTEMYRDLLGHLERSLDRFDFAPGATGMVMIVFTLPSYDYVFKVIRDRFAYPKENTREDVMSRYQLVFEHDRAGRLVEAQEFEHLTFEARRFTPELLEELATAASRSVTARGDEVAIHHLYVERRVRPLNLYLREVDAEAARGAIEDYGQAIRDLAATNIFPGDLLLKNFGVTRNRRVIFYDYDELCLLTDCIFRDLPAARDDAEEMAADAWFYVGEHDVFPEEFVSFLELTSEHRAIFVEKHRDVLRASFWRGLQERHRSGEVMDVFPYPEAKRLRRPGGGDGASGGAPAAP